MKQDGFIYKTNRPWPNKRLKVAAIVGHTTANSTRLWVRTGEPGQYKILYFDANDSEANDWFSSNKNNVPFSLQGWPEAIRRTDEFESSWKNDVTHVANIKGLEPGTTWRYALCRLSGGQQRIILGQDRVYDFRTPTKDTDAPFRFGLFSCHMPFAQKKLFKKKTELVNMDMWDIMSAAFQRRRNEKGDLDFIIAGGDQCYVDSAANLDIWRHLNKVMRKENGQLLPTEESMLEWYRDIYRGYWGFEPVQHVFSSFPTYMIWDDHEICDGWGSYFLPDELDEILPSFKERNLTPEDTMSILARMKSAATQAYEEYQHAHNPITRPGEWDYGFTHKSCAFYVLDGRGHRDVNRNEYRILGDEQFERFKDWVKDLNPQSVKALFVVSAVPVLHTSAVLGAQAFNMMIDALDLTDDLRDAWEHPLHQQECAALMKLLSVPLPKASKPPF